LCCSQTFKLGSGGICFKIIHEFSQQAEIESHSSITIRTKGHESPWSESASELYWPSDRLLSAKIVPTSANTVCHVVSVTDSYDRTVGFLS
jgi:hypothetical protein